MGRIIGNFSSYINIIYTVDTIDSIGLVIEKEMKKPSQSLGLHRLLYRIAE